VNVRRERVLILCTHNSSRSQMADRFLGEKRRWLDETRRDG